MCVSRLLEVVAYFKLLNHVLRRVCEVLALKYYPRYLPAPCGVVNVRDKMARSPKSLYQQALAYVCAEAAEDSRAEESLGELPENVELDIILGVHERGQPIKSAYMLRELNAMHRVLRVTDKRRELHKVFQELMESGHKSARMMSMEYIGNVEAQTGEKAVEMGLAFGKFLGEAGWFRDAEYVLDEALKVCLRREQTEWFLAAGTKISACLLKVQSVYCRFFEAEETLLKSKQLSSKLLLLRPSFNLAFLFTEYSLYYFLKGLYAESYEWSMSALQKLDGSVNPGIAIDALRQATKACIVCRKFPQAKLVIKEAVMMARSSFGERSLKYADSLTDYAFYLLNVDLTDQSVQVYQCALEIRSRIFTGANINVALVHEELAYAQYVKEYSTGRFLPARTHAEHAITIMQKLLPPNHLLLASSKRIKALILEEIAIDMMDMQCSARYLIEAEKLHLSALELSLQAFGEMNVQTAKHYGNLGRLYQSMHQFSKAEEMHLKAIKIKEALLGAEDYEVALSLGHLASLYNYDMKEYGKAEALYLRSVRIGLKLFGESYSGLEYDYRGLKAVYQNTGKTDMASHYIHLLNIWKMVRESAVTYQEPPLSEGPAQNPEPIDSFIRGFFRKDCEDKRTDSSRSPNA